MSTHSEEMKRVQRETFENRGRFKPTPEMEKKRNDYLALLEARKRGEAPLYTVAETGKRYE